MNILDGNFLIQITTHCIKLSSLRLHNLGLAGKCNYMHNLVSALRHCKNLKDFR
nr:unnamed protein product [Timema bartmani]